MLFMQPTIKSLNEFAFTSDTCIGYTRKGEMFVVDLDMFDRIKDYTWWCESNGYFITNIPDRSKPKGQIKVKLHRFVTDCPSNMVVDHIHGPTSRHDNRLCNLRICTNKENQFNRVAINSIGIKGVAYVAKRHKFQTQIQLNGRLKYLGMFSDIVEAANAYDKAAFDYMGQFALLNNMQGPLPLPVEKRKRRTATEIQTLTETVFDEQTGEQTVRERTIRHYYTCSICGKSCTSANLICAQCTFNRRAQDFQKRHPDVNRETLKQLIRTTPFTTIATQYGVSDKAICKWCKKYNLPYKARDIKRYSDAEWETL